VVMWFKKKEPIENIVPKIRAKYPRAYCRIYGNGPSVVIDSGNPAVGNISYWYDNSEKAWRNAYKTLMYN